MKINFRLAEKQGSSLGSLKAAIIQTRGKKGYAQLSNENSHKRITSFSALSSPETFRQSLPEAAFKFNYNKPKVPSAESILEELNAN